MALLVVACQPKTVIVEKEVEKIVEKEVEKIVTQEVEKVVEKQVEVEKVVTATPAPIEAGEDTGKVFILGAFRGSEETAFNDVIAAFEEQNPEIDVIYSGTAEFETLITVRVEAGDPPDIAAFPQPGAVAKLAREGEIVPLWDEALALYDEQYQPAWKDLSQVDGVPYGMFHRVNAKGWIWYNKPAWEAAGWEIPTTWDELMALTEEMKGSGIAPWCDAIGSGAATGWKGTDWVENLMLRTQPVSVYDAWVAHELPFSSDEVKNAWGYLDTLWMDTEAVFGGAQTIALTNFRDPAAWLFEDPAKCWMHMQGSFVTDFFPQEVQADLDNQVGVFMMPPIDDSLPFTLEVGGDQYVVFAGKDRPEVRKFIEFLAMPDSVQPWAEQGGSLFPHKNQDISWYPTELERNMAQAIVTAEAARFDGSDNMASEVNLAFWKGMTDWVSGSRTLDEALADIDATLP
jgi:alpha-glucoside transport system substrate-binding protein